MKEVKYKRIYKYDFICTKILRKIKLNIIDENNSVVYWGWREEKGK